MASMLSDAIAAEHLLLSTAGRHAKEEWSGIVRRKAADIASVGYSLWVLNSNHARPAMVQEYCANSGARYVFFITRATNIRPTSQNVDDKGTMIAQTAAVYSADSANWLPIARELSPVTGRLNRGTTGLWLNALEEVSEGSIDLSAFAMHPEGEPFTGFKQSDPAYLVQRLSAVGPGRYKILAVGELAEPFAVWLKQ